ncbi:MAG: chromate transporter [Peptococcaceae bacterium]
MSLELQKNIFLGFFRAGMLGYGGGPASIPLVHDEVVKRYRWMTDEEFSDVLALGNTLPGPIATKMAGYIGYRIGGVAGSINATLATVLPTVLIMIGLIGFLSKYQNSPVIKGMTQAVAPVVGVMLFSLAYSFIDKAKTDMGWTVALIIGMISLVAYQFLNIHPALVIGVLLSYGLLGGRVNFNKKDKGKDKS